MAFQCQFGISRRHAIAIILHLNTLFPGPLNTNGNMGSSGIKAVLHQLFCYRSRPLHHLTGGNLVGHLRGENMDHIFGHGIISRMIEFFTGEN